MERKKFPWGPVWEQYMWGVVKTQYIDGNFNDIGNFVIHKFTNFCRVWSQGRACCFTQMGTHLTLNLLTEKSKDMESSGLYRSLSSRDDLHSICTPFSPLFLWSKCRVLSCQGYSRGSDLGKPLFSCRICIVALSASPMAGLSHARVSFRTRV